MLKKFLVGVGLLATATFGVSVGAGAAPNPSPTAVDHTGTGCATVIANNPNAGPDAHMSAVGAANFSAVGEAFCGL